MNFNKISFRVFENTDCPLYRRGDRFSISGIAVLMQGEEGNSLVSSTVITLPPNRENCKTLCGDFNRLVLEHERADLIPEGIISCSGCMGMIKLEFSLKDFLDEGFEEDGDDQTSLLLLLQNFPFFKNIDRTDLGNVVKLFSRRKYNRNEIIIRRGDRGDNFYVVISGKVKVLNDAALPIATLSVGEVFGEMSLLSDESASATVQAPEETEILYIDNRKFKKILSKYPVLQNYFTRLLAKRLSHSNKFRSGDISSMAGKLEEIPPEALFQTLNAKHKTGILTITQLPRGTARFSLRQGGIIRAGYGGQKGKRAFYEVLKEKKGRYKFTPGLPPEDFDAPEIGFFMKLLMEGLQKEEEHR
ncbi:MAG: cyclic nucleotide-binding domain-containing protein [Desulfobulbaceae bacterium]|nr:cyclic nucleotide-binding domain-containing protein [Desulfobulbaceae bacterium]